MFVKTHINICARLQGAPYPQHMKTFPRGGFQTVTSLPFGKWATDRPDRKAVRPPLCCVWLWSPLPLPFLLV